MDIWQNLQKWAGDNWWVVALILAGAFIARRFGDALLAGLIRRTVRYRAHGDISDEDIKKRQDTLVSMCTTIMHVLIWSVAIFSIVELIFPNIDLTPLLASASILGVAIGFGAQTLIKDFLSGVFIIMENQYRVGDVVEIDGASGTVEQITIRSTVVRDNNGSVHYIPNGNVMHAINKTMGFAKINVAIAVTPDTDVDKLADIINEVGNKLALEEKWQDKIIEAPHFLSIGAFNDTSLEVKIIGKTQPSGQWAVSGELRRRLLAAIKKQHITLAHLPTTGTSNATPKKK